MLTGRIKWNASIVDDWATEFFYGAFGTWWTMKKKFIPNATIRAYISMNMSARYCNSLSIEQYPNQRHQPFMIKIERVWNFTEGMQNAKIWIELFITKWIEIIQNFHGSRGTLMVYKVGWYRLTIQLYFWNRDQLYWFKEKWKAKELFCSVCLLFYWWELKIVQFCCTYSSDVHSNLDGN